MIRAGFLSLRAAIARPTSDDHHCPAVRRKYVLAAAILASSLGFIDGSVVAIAIPAIRTALGATFAEAQWIHNGYVLLLSALILVGGAAGDRFGQRDVFAAGIVVFVLASLWCGLATTPTMLIVARIVQGLGAAFMVPGSLALIARNYPAEIRGRAIGLWAAISGIAAALGPVAGGAILTLAGAPAWRWLFLINLPLGAVALALIFARVPRDRPVIGGALDWTGAVLVTFGLGLMAYGLTVASKAAAGGIAMIAGFGGAAMLIAFVVWEGRVKMPMMPLSLFRSKVFSGANGLTFLLYFALGGVLFFLPMTLIQAWHLPEAQAGAIFLPFTLVMAGLSQYAGRLSDRLGTRLPLTLGPLVTGLAFAWLAAVLRWQDFWFGIIPAMLLLGAGLGLAVPVLSSAVMLAADDDRAGAASGINNAVARVASLFAVAGLGIVAATVYQASIAAMSMPADVVASLQAAGFGEPLAGKGLGHAAQTAHAHAMVVTMQVLAMITAVLSLMSAAIAWTTQSGRRQTVDSRQTG